MSFKQTSSFPASSIDHSAIKTEVQSNINGCCQVCGDKALILNYGALSCASCKTFFRRHGFHPKDVPKCSFYGNCEITIQSRRICAACRFAKCLSVGMTPDRIRKEDLSGKHSLTVKPKRQKTSASNSTTSNALLPTLNLVSNDVSPLTTSNWALLSNIVHAFDSFSPTFEMQHVIDFFIQNSDNDHFHLQHTQTLLNPIYRSLKLSIAATADFRIMTTDEQCSLINRNFNGVWALYSLVVCHKCNLFSNERSKNIMKPLYGSDTVEYVTLMSSRIDPDETLVKLLLMTLVFSSNCFALTDDQKLKRDSLLFGTFRLFGSQNAYVEVMWKYMVYRYGYFESAKRFSNLVKIMLDEVQLSSTIYDNNKVHQNLADEIVEETKMALVKHGSESIPLWGKTET